MPKLLLYYIFNNNLTPINEPATLIPPCLLSNKCKDFVRSCKYKAIEGHQCVFQRIYIMAQNDFEAESHYLVSAGHGLTLLPPNPP